MCCLLDEIRDVCVKFGDKPAVAFCETNGEVKNISYQRLAQASRALKNLLLTCSKDFNLENHNCIGVMIEPKGSFPAIILGILMCECPFLCFDVCWPEELVINLINYLKIDIIVTDVQHYYNLESKLSRKITSLRNCQLIGDDIKILSTGREKLNNYADGGSSNLEMKKYKSNYMYAIQTSGSTGQPKIVRVPEVSILPNLKQLRNVFGITHLDGIYFSSPVTFDPSIVELFLSMMCGATLFIVPSAIKAAVSDVLRLLFAPSEKKADGNKFGITFIQTTPSLFLSWPKEFVRNYIMDDNTHLKVLALGGECCPSWDVISRYKSESNETKIYNLYGITEVSCWASVHLVSPGDDGSNLGYPLNETVLEVRDVLTGKQVTQGIGEMFIGSTTRLCLVDDENFDLIDYRRVPVYRPTGDMVEVDDKCSLYSYIGRKDSMIKRWGHRVCLAQIERLASTYDYCDWCSCFNYDDYGLVLFVRFTPDKSVTSNQSMTSHHFYSNELRRMLSTASELNPASIPDYIVPVQDVYLRINSHGKVNRSSLKCVLKSEIEKFNSKLRNKLLSFGKDNFKLIYKEMWDKYTNKKSKHISNNYLKNEEFQNNFSSEPSTSFNLLPIEKSSRNEQKCDLICVYKLGFLSSGGHSMAAIQFVSELSQFMTVPNIFIVKLLGDCSFEESLQLLGDNLEDKVKSDEFIEVIAGKNKKRLPAENDIDKTVPFPFLNDCGNEIKRLKSFEMINEFVPDQIDDYVVSVKCRGKTINYPNDYCQKRKILKFEVLQFVKKPLQLKVQWKYYLRKCVDASPTIVSYESGKLLVMIGSHSGHLGVVNVFDGKLVSECVLPNRIESSVLPSKCGKHYFVGCYDGKLYCVDIISGNVIWSFATSDMVKSTPIYGSESTLVFGSYDKNLYCVTANNGSEIWRYKGNAGFLSVPCLSDCGKILAASLDGMCTALAVNSGTLIWEHQLDSPVFASPVLLDGQNKVVFAQVTGILCCLNLTDGTLVWKFSAGGNIFSSLTFCEDKSTFVFGCHDNNVYCLSVKSDLCEPKIVWKKLVDSAVFATPFVTKIDSELIVAVCSTKGVSHVLDLNDGTILVSFHLPNEIFSSPVIEAGHIIFGCRDDYVYCLRLETQGDNDMGVISEM